MDLQECFSKITDPRQASGLRFPLSSFLCMMVMSYMSGWTGYRASALFMKGNEEELSRIFGLKHGTPGHTQIRTIVNRLDFAEINKAFYNWSKQFVPITKGEWVAADGKSLRSTVTDPFGSEQDFELIVRLFAVRLGVSIQAARTTNRKSERKAFVELMKGLSHKGITITLDAYYCQKKH